MIWIRMDLDYHRKEMSEMSIVEKLKAGLAKLKPRKKITETS